MAAATSMTGPEDRRRARRNVWLALVHAALALGVMALYLWTRAQG